MLRPYNIRPDYLSRPQNLSLVRGEAALLNKHIPNVTFPTPNLAVLEINGPIANSSDLFDVIFYGAQDHAHIRAGIAQIAASPAQTVILHITTPGGSSTGTIETAKQLAALSQLGKKTITYIPDQCCSAGMALAVATDMIIAAPSAIVGSIGTILAGWDSSAAYAEEGLVPMIFQRGTLKATGSPGKEWTDDEKEFLDDIVGQYDAPFKAWITSRRPQIDMTKQQGQWFMAANAPTGLIDALADDITDLLKSLS
jgi:ClpP class serine protease